MSVWQAIIMGLVQGLTEFLPVSSSGHLVLLQRLFGIDGGLFLPIVLHLGTLVAVCVVFFKDILALFKKPFKTLGFLVLASVPAAVVGLLLDDIIEDAIFGGKYFALFLAAFFLITGCVLFATEKFAKKREGTLPLNLKVTLSMGFAQAVAILPGISRSGSTICAGTFAGGKREEIAKFSFLMSLPVILGSFVIELFKGLKDGEIQTAFSSGGASFGIGVAVGFVVSAVSGLFAIKLMLKLIQKANYKWFSLYLGVLSVTCVILQFTYFA